MRAGLAITGLAAASLLAAGVMATTPAYADSGTHTAYVSTGSANQYLKSCSSPSTCNAVTSGSSQSMSCTQRPATQVWHIEASCRSNMGFNIPLAGNQVTGDGTSTISSNCPSLFGGTFFIDS